MTSISSSPANSLARNVQNKDNGNDGVDIRDRDNAHSLFEMAAVTNRAAATKDWCSAHLSIF